MNELLYVPARISNVSFNDLPWIKGPGWFALPAAEAAAIMEKRKDLSVALPFGDEKQWQLLKFGRRFPSPCLPAMFQTLQRAI